MLLDLAGKLASFKNREIQHSSLEIHRFQLSEGLYTSLSFDRASEELQFILKEKTKITSLSLKEDRTQGKELMAIFMRVDKLIANSGLYELIQKVITGKFSIVSLLILDGSLDEGFKNLLVKYFGGKFDEKLMVRRKLNFFFIFFRKFEKIILKLN